MSMITGRIFVAVALCALAGPFAGAEDPPPQLSPPAVGVQLIRAHGSVAHFSENTITVRSEPSGVSVPYSIVNTTQWVDEGGNSVTEDRVRSGTRVAVQSTQGADGLEARKIVVLRNTSDNAISSPAKPGTQQISSISAPPLVEGTGDDAVIKLQNNPSEADTSLPKGVARKSALSDERAELANAVEALGPTGRMAPVRNPQLPRTMPPPRVFHKAFGTVVHVGDGYISMRSGDSAAPVQYRYSDTTRWMDNTGHVLRPGDIGRGASLTLDYFPSTQGLIISNAVAQRNNSDSIIRRNGIEEIQRPIPNVEGRRIVEEHARPRVTARRSVVFEETPAWRVIRRPAPAAVEVRRPHGSETFLRRTTERRTFQSGDEDDDDDDDE